MQAAHNGALAALVPVPVVRPVAAAHVSDVDEGRLALRGDAAPVALEAADRIAHARVRLAVTIVPMAMAMMLAVAVMLAVMLAVMAAVVTSSVSRRGGRGPALAVAVTTQHASMTVAMTITAMTTFCIAVVSSAEAATGALPGCEGRSTGAAALANLQQHQRRLAVAVAMLGCSVEVIVVVAVVTAFTAVARAATALVHHRISFSLSFSFFSPQTSQRIVVINGSFRAVLPRLLRRRVVLARRSFYPVLMLMRQHRSLGMRSRLCFGPCSRRLCSERLRFRLRCSVRRRLRFSKSSRMRCLVLRRIHRLVFAHCEIMPCRMRRCCP